MKKSIIVALLHNIDWAASIEKVEINKHLSINKYIDSRAHKLVLNLSKKKNLDEGEPLTYNAFIEFIGTDKETDENCWWDSPVIIDRIISLIGILNGGGVPNFQHFLHHVNYSTYSCKYIETIAPENRHDNLTFLYEMPFTKKVEYELNGNNLSLLKIAYNNLQTKSVIGFDRLRNAVDFYSRAWRAFTPEETIIFLSVAFESLFAPHSNAEISNQMSVNVSKFLFTDLKDRIWCKKVMKEIYSERSKILHGGSSASHDKQWEIMWNAYALLSKVLAKILCDFEYTELFRSDRNRKEYLDGLLLS